MRENVVTDFHFEWTRNRGAAHLPQRPLSRPVPEDPAVAPGPRRRRLRPAIDTPAGGRAPRVDRTTVRVGRPGYVPRLAGGTDPGDRRRPGQERPDRRGPPRVPAAAGRGRPGPRRHHPRPGDEPVGPVVQGLASV